MADETALDAKLYRMSEGKTLSFRDLLAAFTRQGTARMTDLHLKVGKPPSYRVDGQIKITNGMPLDAETMEKLGTALLDEKEKETLERNRSVNCSRLIGEFRFRVNAFFDQRGLSMAIRALDKISPKIEYVGFPNGVWEDIIKLRQGLVLVTGTTGAGKSTTIAALIDRIASTRHCHIITLEDPVEYELRSDTSMISQRAVGRDVPNFEAGIRDCMREDPDVIFVGEMTEKESATWTITAAETGHLVFSGIHTRDAIGTINRIIDLYPPNRAEEVASQLALSLRFILSQKLVQRDDTVGRVVAMEILNNNYAMQNLIRQIKPEQMYSVIQTQVRDAPGQRMTTLERSLANLVKAGRITRAEAERACNHPPVFADEMKRVEAQENE